MNKRILFSIVIILIAALLSYGAFLLWKSNQPAIQTIPVRQPGEPLLILGSGFGNHADDSQVILIGQTGLSLTVEEWSPERLVVRLPDPVESGSIRVETPGLFGRRVSAPRNFLTREPGLPSQPNGYAVPVQAESPWPTFRRDHRNSGWSPLPAVYNAGRPWAFQTGKGIFSTPVIDKEGTIYVGSADHYFYAINPDGRLKWKYQTGEVIDSAGAIGMDGTVTFISGDGAMYNFRTQEGIVPAAAREVWRYQAELRPEVSYNKWFEGNVAVGPDGTLYAGNTNFLYYAIRPDGTLKWTYETGANNWSQAAFGEDGTIFWGSNDTYIRGVDPGGQERWNRMTLGFIAASAAIGSDGTVYIGSFDSNLYALDPYSGRVQWRYPTQDHIYSSAALGQDQEGQTRAIYFGSADGFMYAVDVDGTLLWKYDTGDPIRSSPVIGLSREGDEIVYFGCGNGRLYALNAVDGSLRWSFDTTPSDLELADRNDLNGSPALGQSGIYIGGEHGFLWYMPYDYCLNSLDKRCQTTQSGEPSPDFSGLYYVTPGGSTRDRIPNNLPPATMITLRLAVRENGETVNARLCNNPIFCPADSLQVILNPDMPFRAEHSADGRYIYLLPEGFFMPGQEVDLTVKGLYYTGGLRLGNLTLGGKRTGQFESNFKFTVKTVEDQLPMAVSAGETTAIEWTRLAAPLPTMLPSLNQIGFDYIDWIIGTVAVEPPGSNGEGRLLMWALGAKRTPAGRLVSDPDSDFTLPLSGIYRGDSFILSNQNFNMAITGIPIPFNQLQLRGQFNQDLTVRPGAAAFADTEALSIPTFGPYLVIAGLANNWFEKMLVSGTFITRPYPTGDPANRMPTGVKVSTLDFQPPDSQNDGWAEATLNRSPGSEYSASEHRLGLLLVNADTLEPVSLDYHGTMETQVDPEGNLKGVRLPVPHRTHLPANLRIYVMLDVFPAYQEDLTIPRP